MTTDRIALALAGSITEAREAFGLSQRELAEWCGVDRSAVSYWESGRRRPNLTHLLAISETLNMPFTTLTACLDGEGVT